jgi:dynein heavy chain
MKKEGYLAFIKEMPLNPSPEVHWLHQNASLTALINEGFACMRSVVSLMPKGAGGAGKSEGEKFKDLASDIEDRIPKKPYDIEAVRRAYPPNYHDSLNVVLVQELLRFNKLYVKVKANVADLQKAVDGLVVMSAELEAVGTSLLESKVPATWLKVSFPSLKPLGGYTLDFIKRLTMMDMWIEKGAPTAFWISGFFFTQAFLTGIMQNMARRDKVPIDEVIWNFYPEQIGTLESCMQDQYNNPYKSPEIGCYVYGLFIEGARWDAENLVIAESFPKVLFDKIPVILLIPILRTEDKTPTNIYACPIYKTSERRGVLSTTGHSTNFVMTMLLTIAAEHSETYWTRRGTAMLTQLDD